MKRNKYYFKLFVVIGIATVVLGIIFLFAAKPQELVVAGALALIQPPQPVTILAFGDMMLDRTVRDDINEYGAGYPFEKIKYLFPGHDIIVANAEGVFTGNASVSEPDHSILRFTFATSSLPTLKALGFTVLSQANNHALDFGQSGLQTSQDAMAQNGIFSFGDPLNQNPGPLFINVRGQTIAFVGYMQFFSPDASSTLAAIAQAHARGAFVIVYPHWGEEYNLGTTTLQTTLAHKFIDAGADAVLGSHPHVVEPQEIYKGKAIFYSMGNFVFDQSWNGDVTHGLGIQISLTAKEVTYTLIPFAIKNAQPEPTGLPAQAGGVTSFVLKR